MTLPYTEPLNERAPAPVTVPEPPRRGEAGGKPCTPCTKGDESTIWSDQHWRLHNPGSTALVGAVWLSSRVHADSFADLPPAVLAGFGPVVARVERALLGLGDTARVHLYRWGDGGAHFHVWFLPRPLGRLDMQGMMLPIWEEVMTPLTKQEIAATGRRIAAAMVDG